MERAGRIASITLESLVASAVAAGMTVVMFWHPAVAGLYYLLEGELPGSQIPGWYLRLRDLNPLDAYRQAFVLLTGENASLLVGWAYLVEAIDPAVTAEAGWMVASNRVEGQLPLDLSEWFAAVVLLAWITVPIAVGYWRFQRADLNRVSSPAGPVFPGLPRDVRSNGVTFPRSSYPCRKSW